jgi:hypothetical protein
VVAGLANWRVAGLHNPGNTLRRRQVFDASPEFHDDQSKDDEDSIPHDGPGGFVHAIISNMSLMSPPPPRADIILEPDPAKTDENTEDSASIVQDE